MIRAESQLARPRHLGLGIRHWGLNGHWSLVIGHFPRFPPKVARSLLCPTRWATAAVALSGLGYLRTYASKNGSKSSCAAARFGRHWEPFCFILPLTPRVPHPNGRFLSR